VPKHARRVEGFDEAIISLYANGLTTGGIRAHLAEIYGVDVSRDLISRVTDKVVEELTSWQSPPPRPHPPGRADRRRHGDDSGRAGRQPAGVCGGGHQPGRGTRRARPVGRHGGEGAKQWMATLAELRTRGVDDVCIVACDGLEGLPDAIAEIWPPATVQLCVVRLVRASLRYASKAHWSQTTKASRDADTAATAGAAEQRFAEFEQAWGGRYPAIVGL
jgi:transposase-like protein